MVLIGRVPASGTPIRFSILETEFSIRPDAFARIRKDGGFRIAVPAA